MGRPHRAARRPEIERQHHDDNKRITSRLVRVAPMVRDTVPVAEAEWVYDTLRDEPAKLFGTDFDWSST